ncbi:MAG: hypothetical protein AAFX81_12130 [Pseudomonadota bacterium]
MASRRLLDRLTTQALSCAAWDGLWVATGELEPCTDVPDGFHTPSADAVTRLTRLGCLRVDCFGPQALGVLSGEVVRDVDCAEEFRIEGCCMSLASDGSNRISTNGVGAAYRPRVAYVVHLELAEPTTGRASLLIQRLYTRPRPLMTPASDASTSATTGMVEASAVYRVECASELPAAFRRLDIHCAVAEPSGDGDHRTAALAAFGVTPTTLREAHTPIQAVGSSSLTAIPTALRNAGIWSTTRVSSARRGAEPGARLAAALVAIAATGDDDLEAVAEIGAWSEDEIDQAIVATTSAGPNEPPGPAPWTASIVLAPRFAERPHAIGTMFSSRNRPRRGCAVFYDPAGDGAWTAGDARRALTFAAMHELGHLLNLLHCFQAEETRHRRQPQRPDGLTWMNYPNRFPFGLDLPPDDQAMCRDAFWQRFEGEFGREDLMHLRHGWSHDVRPGGAAEPLMNVTADSPYGDIGLEEANAGGFEAPLLLGSDTDLLALLSTDAIEPRRDADEPELHVHLPDDVELGEPVLGWAELRSPGSAPLLIHHAWDLCSGRLRLRIETDHAEPVTFEPHRRDCSSTTAWLPAGQSTTTPLQVSYGATSYFTVAGTYALRFQYGDTLVATHWLRVHPTSAVASSGLNQLQRTDGFGLSLLRHEAPAVAEAGLAALGSPVAALPSQLQRAIATFEAFQTLRTARNEQDVRRQAADLMYRVGEDSGSPGGACRWRDHVSLLHGVARTVLRRNDLPARATAEIALAAAGTSLQLCSSRRAELATTRTARAIRKVAEAIAEW